jgi:hypothetical protein
MTAGFERAVQRAAAGPLAGHLERPHLCVCRARALMVSLADDYAI